MATHRLPKGSYIRDTWEWYEVYDAVVSFVDGTALTPPNTALNTLWSFTNNDPLGRSFHIHVVMGSWDTGFMNILSLASPQILTPVAYGQSIILSQGAQPGVLGYQRFEYVYSFPDPLNPHIGAPLMVLPNTGFQGAPPLIRPLLILPANTTLMLGNEGGINVPLAMTIFYTVLPSGW